MMPAPRSDRGGPPESAYAAELEEGVSRRRFSQALEAEYCAAHLFNSRWLIRVSCGLGAALATLRGLEHLFRDNGAPVLPSHFAFVMAACILLAALAWSPAFTRLYLPCARIIVPVRNAVIAAQIAAVAAAGGTSELMLLPLMIIGPFFFLGLPLLTGVLSSALAIVSFHLFAAVLGMPAHVLARTTVLLGMTAGACAICAHHLQQASRRRFIEGRVITELAEHDALTGTKNRRVFDEHFARIWEQAVRERRSIAVLLLDVDHFKAYNDRYGHQAGDRTLRLVAGALQPFVRRPLDVLARYGGEEFAAVLYDVEPDRVAALAERMRATVEALAIEHDDADAAPVVTISAGVAVVEPTAERRPRGALQLADEALYAAKHGGRNRVHVMGEVEYGKVTTGVFDMGAHAGRGRSTADGA